MAIAVPNPKLRAYFIGASTARHTQKMIRTLEERCTSLFESNSELLIFREDDLVWSLLKPMRTDEMLARFGNRVRSRRAEAVDIRPEVDIRPHQVASARAQPDEISDYAGGNSTRDKSDQTREDVFARTSGPFKSSSELSSFDQVDAVAELLVNRSKSKIVKYPLPIADQVATAPCTDPIQARSQVLRQRPQTKTNSHSAKEDVNPSQQTHERVSEPTTLSITRARARDHFDKISDRAGVRSSWNHFVIKRSGHAEPLGTNTRIQSKVTHPSDIRVLDDGPTRDDEASRPQPKPSVREPRAASFSGSATDERHLTYEQPLTGLRRLAEMAVNVADARPVQSDRQTIADNIRTQSSISKLLLPHFARSEEAAELESAITDFLRQEMLRHGIGLEGS